jgi:hypothetical protein
MINEPHGFSFSFMHYLLPQTYYLLPNRCSSFGSKSTGATITYYLFKAKVFRIATNFSIEQAKVFYAQKTLAWKPVLQEPLQV